MNKATQPTSRLVIASLTPQSQVDEVYRVSDKQLRTNRQGNHYILLQLADRTGSISAMRWNANASLYESFQKGDYLHVHGAAQLHNGNLQLIVQSWSRVDPQQISPTDFDAMDHALIDSLWQELVGIAATIQQEQVRSLVDALLQHPDWSRAYQSAPAGVKTHHAYPGGLLAHVVSLLKIADRIAPLYPELNRDLLLAGVIFHDVGKLQELAFEGELTYTDEGQLVGHLVQGVVMLRALANEVRSKVSPWNEQIVYRLEHMIVSHHGALEHGSPRVPMTLEAIVLHAIDDMDAKLNAALGLIDSDLNSDSDWTTFNPTLGRKLFKPSRSK